MCLYFNRFVKEALACLLAGVLGMPLGVIQFLPVYHPLHDSNKIHTEVCVFLQMAVYVMIAWAGDRKAAIKRHELQGKEKEKKKSESSLCPGSFLFFCLCICNMCNFNASSDLLCVKEFFFHHEFLTCNFNTSVYFHHLLLQSN